MDRPRVVLTFTGSENDLGQVVNGLRVLIKSEQEGVIDHFRTRLTIPFTNTKGESQTLEITSNGHTIVSVHRNPETLNEFLHQLSLFAKANPGTDFVLVMGAGWAAQLPGIADSRLRQVYHAPNIFVVGVALESKPDKDEARVGGIFHADTSAPDIAAGMTAKQQRDLAAIFSLTQVPGTSMITGDDQGVFFGPKGWRRACEFAAHGEIPPEIREKTEDPKTKDPAFYVWSAAIDKGCMK